MLEKSQRAGLRDVDVGVEGFGTATPGLGGRLRVRVEDFRVDELGPAPLPSPTGRFTAARVRLMNWETNAFVREASERLGRSRKTVHFSGTKDKRGVTEQWFTFDADPEAVRRLAEVSGVEVVEVVRTDRELQLGHHAGNRFRVVVRNIEWAADEAGARARATADELARAGGVLNFFGPQRFGSARATTHRVGERVVRGDFEGAVVAYLTLPGPSEDENVRAWRAELARSRDWARGLDSLPASAGTTFDRALLHRLVETHGDPLAALDALPGNLQRLFVSAYQSWLFNLVLSRRLARGLPPGHPLPGDLVVPLEEGRPTDEWIPVAPGNLDRVTVEVGRGRAAVTGILPGTEVPFAAGAMGEIERGVVAEQSVDPRDFLVPERPPWSSKGTRRPLVVPVRGLAMEANPDDLHPGRTRVDFSFVLPPGAYATTVLREFVKSAWLEDYA